MSDSRCYQGECGGPNGRSTGQSLKHTLYTHREEQELKLFQQRIKEIFASVLPGNERIQIAWEDEFTSEVYQVSLRGSLNKKLGDICKQKLPPKGLIEAVSQFHKIVAKHIINILKQNPKFSEKVVNNDMAQVGLDDYFIPVVNDGNPL